MTTTTKRTPEQTERVELIRDINGLIDAGLEIRHNRWTRAVNEGRTDDLKTALAHLHRAAHLIKGL